MIINCAIVDDNESVLSMMTDFCQGIPELRLVHSSVYAKDTFEFLLESATYVDLVYLDINMPGMNGFEIIKEVKSRTEELSPEFAIITAYDHYGPDDSPYPVVDFLYKPVFEEDFQASVEKVLSIFQNRSTHEITASMLDDRSGDLVYLRRMDDYTQCIFLDTRIIGPATWQTLISVDGYCQIQENYIVNRRFIDHIVNKTLVTTRNHHLPISEHFLPNLQ